VPVSAATCLACCDGRGARETLYLQSPLNGTESYLIAQDGTLLHAWSSVSEPGQSTLLQEDGGLVRVGAINSIAPDNPFVVEWTSASGLTFNVGGIVERIARSGELLWTISTTATTSRRTTR